MYIDAAERDLELRKSVEPRLLCPPIERGAPIFDEPLQIADIGAIGPWLAGSLVGIAGAPEPFAQIGDGLLGNGEGEALRLRSHLHLARIPTLTPLQPAASSGPIAQHQQDRPYPTRGPAACRRPSPRLAPLNRTLPWPLHMPGKPRASRLLSPRRARAVRLGADQVPRPLRIERPAIARTPGSRPPRARSSLLRSWQSAWRGP